MDGSGNLFIADEGYNRIEMLSAKTGFVTTVAVWCSPTQYSRPNCVPGFLGDGEWQPPLLNQPDAVSVDVPESLHRGYRQRSDPEGVLPAGIITTVAGGGTGSFADNESAVSETLGGCAGPVRGRCGRLREYFFSDSGDNRIRKVSPSGIVTTVAGGGCIYVTYPNVCPGISPAMAAPRQLLRCRDPVPLQWMLWGIFSSPDVGNVRIREITGPGPWSRFGKSVLGDGRKRAADGHVYRVRLRSRRRSLLERPPLKRNSFQLNHFDSADTG